ncbi:MAG: hypothetical protein K6F50_09495 [Kiritimatiellae bacterium]|nr:hypothetical protein [Kiritimatiellia bacterium]
MKRRLNTCLGDNPDGVRTYYATRLDANGENDYRLVSTRTSHETAREIAGGVDDDRNGKAVAK